MRKKAVIGYFFAIMFAVLTCAACNNSLVNQRKVAMPCSDPVAYGNHIYYFNCSYNCTMESFGKALADFIGKNPELEFTSLTGDSAGSYGSDLGYFAVFREKQECAPPSVREMAAPQEDKRSGRPAPPPAP